MPIQTDASRRSGPSVVTWAASADRLETPAAADRTYRLIVRTSVGGQALRIRLSNAFGERPVVLGPVYVGECAGGPEVAAGTNRPLAFGGSATVTVAPGAEVYSDPLPGSVRAAADLAVSLYVQEASGTATGHTHAGQTSYTGKGDLAGASGPAGYTEEITSWFHLDAVTVEALEPDTGAVVAFGDSITDGSASTDNANLRWPDQLARRLLADPAATVKGVANAGISGNQVLTDGAGVSALKRLDRDVLSHDGVRTVLLLQGVNDLKAEHRPTADDLIAGYREIIARGRAAGKRVIGGTILPFLGWPGWTEEAEAHRRSVNAFVRHSREFDAVVDFDLALRDPGDHARLLPAFDCGDHLHPNDAGMRALAEAVDLTAL